MACCAGTFGHSRMFDSRLMPSRKLAACSFGPGDRQPAGAVTGDAVGLGQAVERQAQQVGRHRRHRDVLGVVVEDLVVDLVGEQQQLVLARQFGDLLEDLAAVHRAGRVVRVDHDQRLGARR